MFSNLLAHYVIRAWDTDGFIKQIKHIHKQQKRADGRTNTTLDQEEGTGNLAYLTKVIIIHIRVNYLT